MQSMKEVQRARIRSNKGRTHFTFRGIRLGGCLFLFCMLACNTSKRSNLEEDIKRIQALVKSGDVIVRNGNDEVSNAARSFNRKDKTYSHCGLVQVEQDTAFVYHALGGSYNPSQKLLRQTMKDFCSDEDIDKVAVFRYPLDDKESAVLSSWTQHQYRNGLAFDLFFNFQTDDKMYCSEFVFKGLNTAKNNTLKKLLPVNEETLYIAIDDLYLNEWAEPVAEQQF
jgi:hypothetical protein